MNIAVVGYGLEGKAVAKYFTKKGHKVTICDLNEKEELNKESFCVRLGSHYLENLEGFDLVFRSPGISCLKPEFNKVRAKLTSLTKYFFENCPCPIVGVTGTKGKGTVSSLIYEMLKAGTEGKRSRIFMGGNMGHPPLDFLDELTAEDVIVLELSSFQLHDLNKSPHVAVVLGISPDHMDYHADMDEYVNAKKNIVKFQKAEDFAVLDADNKISSGFAKETPAHVLHFSKEKPIEEGGFVKVGSFILKHGKTGTIFGDTIHRKLIGPHNIGNILAAATAASALRMPVGAIAQVVRTHPGLPHRIEFVREVNEVRFYNDSASTNPETAIAALRAFDGPVVLIAGGSEKNADYTPLGTEVANRPNVKRVILMGQTQSKIEKAIEEAFARDPKAAGRREAPVELITSESYQEAFMVAKMVAEPGDTVLLSPASASFDMFANYKERGETFRDFVMETAPL
ncbi:MAG: UDP-N-acetylmuramoyl-L-alanine--D-glutamate ligase [Patescibacteria group bacterium]